MKNYRLFNCLLIFLSLTSCTRIMLMMNGGHMPRVENEESILAYSEKMGWRTDNIFTFRDSSGFNNYMRTVGTLPWVDFYNGEGILMKLRQKGECAKVVDSIINALAPGNSYPVDSSCQLNALMPTLWNLSGKPDRSGNLTPADFYAVIYWATFVGHLNKTDTKVWEEQLYEKAETMGIEVFKVNCDFQEAWELD